MVKNITPQLVYRLNDMHHVVAQVGAVVDNHIFALQLLHSAHDVLVYRKHEGLTKNIDYTDPHLVLTGFGHTQTWVPANDKDEYFVGASLIQVIGLLKLLVLNILNYCQKIIHLTRSYLVYHI